MSLDKKQINNIAWLARLAIDEDDLMKYGQDLSNILVLVEKMNVVNTTNIEPMTHPLELKARLRKDEVSETNQREAFQSNAPAIENGLYLVPKVIE